MPTAARPASCVRVGVRRIAENGPACCGERTMRTTPCAWSMLLGAGVALWATALRGPSEQRIREVVDSCLQGVVNTDRGVLERAGDRNACVKSVKAGEEGGEAAYVIPIDAIFDRWTPVVAKTSLIKVQSVDAVDGKMEAVKFKLDLNEGKYIDCLCLYQVNGG